MKAKFLTILALIFLLSIFQREVRAQNQPVHYYVTIGVFSVLENAVSYTSKANKANFHAEYAINPSRKLYYVYLLDTEDKRKAFAFGIKMKVETEFKDAWVFIGHLGEQPAETIAVKKDPEPVKEISTVPTQPVEPKKDSVVATPVAKVDSSALVTKEKPSGKAFFFKAINSVTGMDVNGEVHILMSPKATQYQAFPLNKLVYLNAPPSGVMSAVVAAPGYKEMGKAINYDDPAASAAEIGPQQENVISFPLVRVKLGDYVEFANVRFFPNTAILQPEAKNELDGFVDLMKENLKYKIKVHGHCNGKKARDITSKGNSPHFFATDPANLKENASAKKLSEYRAQIIKDYMVSQGIDASRIGVKGEGGNQMIYLANSSHAARNDRVEIEVSKGR